MKKVILCLLLCLTLLPATAFAEDKPQAPDELLDQPKDAAFAVLHTGDINGREGAENGAVGFPLLSALKQDTARAYGTLLLDSGNALGGDGLKTVKLMGAAGYDAAAIGTRDAALGLDALQNLAAVADFPLLCANWLRDDGELLFEPYTIVEMDGVKVGVIGLISPQIAEDHPDVTQGCNVYKPSAIANIYYEEMVEQGCTYFIALTSLGYDGEYTPRHLGQESPWLSLILDSNTGTLLDNGELVPETNVVVFNLPVGFAAVGSAVVSLVDGQTILTPSVVAPGDLAGLPPDANVQSVVEADYSPGASGGGLPAGVIFLIALAVIGGGTALLLVFMARKKAKPVKK